MASLRLPNVNRVEIAGRLTRDAEFRTSQSGTEFGKLQVAVSRKWKGQEETYWASVMLFGKSIEWLKTELRKGRAVLVQGRLSQYKDKDGKTWHTQIMAESVQMLDWRDDQPPVQAAPHTPTGALPDIPSYGPPDDDEDMF